MAITGLPILGFLKASMQWHEARQRVLAENIANADMPGFQPRDLVAMGEGGAAPKLTPVSVAVTHAAHLAGQSSEAGRGYGERREAGWETTPDGNSVVLEEQMLKLSQNQMDHQTVTTLYGRSLAMLRAAVRSG